MFVAAALGEVKKREGSEVKLTGSFRNQPLNGDTYRIYRQRCLLRCMLCYPCLLCAVCVFPVRCVFPVCVVCFLCVVRFLFVLCVACVCCLFLVCCVFPVCVVCFLCVICSVLPVPKDWKRRLYGSLANTSSSPS